MFPNEASRAGRFRTSVAWLALFGAAVACSQRDDIIAATPEPVEPDVQEPTVAEPNAQEPEPSTPINSDDPCLARCGSAACPCPPGVRIDLQSDTGIQYAIDATEVTVAQYRYFVDGGPTPQEAADVTAGLCDWNETHAPAESSIMVDERCLTDFDFDGFLQETPGKPVVCVDWCDAQDYCAWVGGHLCGRFTGGGLDFDTLGTTDAEWYSACSANGTQTYVYGDEFDPLACNTRESDHNQSSIEVMQLPDCEGPPPGLFDMNGNADEWTVACDDFDTDDPANVTCYRVGGAFFQGLASQSRCDSAIPAQRALLGNNTGFRCCYSE